MKTELADVARKLEEAFQQQRWHEVYVQLLLLLEVSYHLARTGRINNGHWGKKLVKLTQLCLEALLTKANSEMLRIQATHSLLHLGSLNNPNLQPLKNIHEKLKRIGYQKLALASTLSHQLAQYGEKLNEWMELEKAALLPFKARALLTLCRDYVINRLSLPVKGFAVTWLTGIHALIAERLIKTPDAIEWLDILQVCEAVTRYFCLKLPNTKELVKQWSALSMKLEDGWLKRLYQLAMLQEANQKLFLERENPVLDARLVIPLENLQFLLTEPNEMDSSFLEFL